MVNKKKSKCLFCSLGCGFMLETQFGEAVNLDYDPDDPVGKGALCGKGNYLLELLNHPLRLTEPKEQEKTLMWNDALGKVAAQLAPLAGTSMADVIISGDASVEDVLTAKLFSEVCLKKALFSVHFATGDDKVYRSIAGLDVPQASLDDIENSAYTIAVGDPFEIGPVIAGRTLGAKYAKRSNLLASVASKPNRTSHFASVHLEGSERKTLAGLLRAVIEITGEGNDGWKGAILKNCPVSDDPAVAKCADGFVKTQSAVLMLETQDPLTAQLAALVVKAAGKDKRLFCVYTYGNVGDICDTVGDCESVDSIIEAADRNEIEALVILGADIIGSLPDGKMNTALGKCKFVAAGASFENETTRIAQMVLPNALWLETEGTYNGTQLSPVIEPPGGALSSGEILRRIAVEMGSPLPDINPEKITNHEEPTAESIISLLKAIEEVAPEPVVRSSVVRYADGSITDAMSYIAMQEREVW